MLIRITMEMSCTPVPSSHPALCPVASSPATVLARQGAKSRVGTVGKESNLNGAVTATCMAEVPSVPRSRVQTSMVHCGRNST